MTVLTTDLAFYKSSNGVSVGGTISATVITNSSLNNIFDDVTAAEALSGSTEYRKIFFKNNHGSDSLISPVLWRSVDTLSPDDEISIGIGTADDDDGSSELVAMTANSKVTLVSDGSDTRSVNITGEDNSGNRQSETIVLTGTTPVDSSNNYSKLYRVNPTASGTRILTIKQKSTGATLGTVGLNKLSAILYQNVTTKETGIKLLTIAPGNSGAVWLKRTVVAGAGGYELNQGTIKIEGETA